MSSASGTARPLPARLRARLKREWQKVQGLAGQIGSTETERRAGGAPSAGAMKQVRQLATLRQDGVQSAGGCW